MSLVDYPLFSWVVFIHSLHVSSFREAHHQEIIFPVQSASGIVCNLCCSLPVLLRVLLNNFNQLNMFRAIITPILRGTRQLVVYCTEEAALWHLVGCLYYCINDARSHKHKMQLKHILGCYRYSDGERFAIALIFSFVISGIFAKWNRIFFLLLFALCVSKKTFQ